MAKYKNVVGIDIGLDTLRVASLSFGNPNRLIGLNAVSIPPSSWSPETIKNIDILAKAIDMALFSAKPSKINTKYAMIALPEVAVFSGAMSINCNPKDLATAIPLNAAEKLSINVEDYYLDWEKGNTELCLNTGVKSKNPTQVVFVVATKKTLVNSIIELLKKANLEVGGIDVKPGAIARAVASNDHISRLIVDLGAGTTGISVTIGTSLCLISTVPIGTKSIVVNPILTAQDYRNKFGSIFDELVHSTKYFENRLCPTQKIKEVILTGVGSNIPGIDNLFKRETGINTRIGNPFSKVDTHHFPLPKELANTFSDAVGLAMRRSDD